MRNKSLSFLLFFLLFASQTFGQTCTGNATVISMANCYPNSAVVRISGEYNTLNGFSSWPEFIYVGPGTHDFTFVGTDLLGQQCVRTTTITIPVISQVFNVSNIQSANPSTFYASDGIISGTVNTNNCGSTKYTAFIHDAFIQGLKYQATTHLESGSNFSFNVNSGSYKLTIVDANGVSEPYVQYFNIRSCAGLANTPLVITPPEPFACSGATSKVSWAVDPNLRSNFGNSYGNSYSIQNDQSGFFIQFGVYNNTPDSLNFILPHGTYNFIREFNVYNSYFPPFFERCLDTTEFIIPEPFCNLKFKSVNKINPNTATNTPGSIIFSTEGDFCGGQVVELRSFDGLSLFNHFYLDTARNYQIEGLPARQYKVVLSSGSFCRDTADVTLVQCDINSNLANASTQYTLCAGPVLLALSQPTADLIYTWKRNGAVVGSSSSLQATLPGSYYVVVSSLDGECKDSSQIVEVIACETLPGSGKALSFDGVDDYATFPVAMGTSPYSIECWVKFADGDVVNKNILVGTDGNPMANWSHQIRTDALGRFQHYTFSFSGGAQFRTGDEVVAPNKWYHVCITTSASNVMNLYVNGVKQGGDLSVGNNWPGVNQFHVASQTGGGAAIFKGEVDEIRVWKTALTEAQVRERMCRKIVSIDPLSGFLAAYIKGDETAGNLLINNYLGGNGELFNGAVRVTSGAPIGDQSAFHYVTTGLPSVNLTLSGADVFNANYTSGTYSDIAGAHVYAVTSKPNTENGIPDPGTNNRYFGVFTVNINSPQYTGTWNYTGNPFVTEANENRLALYKRNNNASTSWANTPSTQNINTNILTFTGSATEYNLGVSPCSTITAPTVTAGGPTTFCTGGSVTLTSSAATGNLWSTGATTQSITVSNTGSYSVQIIAAGCTSSVSNAVVVTVNPSPTTPTASAGGPTTFCAGGSVTLTSSAATGNLWSTGATTQSITVSNTGSYSVQTIAAGCTSSVSNAVVVTVNPSPTTPTASTGGPTTFCAGGSVTLTSSSATGNLWSSGETTQSITVSSTGNFTVRTIAAGCTSAVSNAVAVTVNPTPTTPTASAGGPTTFCAGGSVTLTSSAATGNLWSSGETTQSITVSNTGNFTVRTIVAGCTSAVSNAVAVTVNPSPATPTISASGPLTFCQGGSVILTSSSPTGNTWSNGATTPSITVSASGNFSVTVSNGSCASTSAVSSVAVISNPPTPTISASGPLTFCEGGSVVLVSSAPTGNTWSTGATTQSITVSATGNYSVTVGASGCSATSSSTEVTVTPLPTTPTVSAGGSTTFCAGGSVTLTSSSASGNLWSSGQTTQSITVSSTGNFTVRTIAAGCTSAVSNAVAVTVNPTPTTPTVSAGGSTTFCAGGSVTLTSSSASGNLWSSGETTQSITVSSSGNFSVRTIAAGCTSAVSVPVNVSVIPNPTVTTSGNVSIALGGSTTLTASGATTYQWSPLIGLTPANGQGASVLASPPATTLYTVTGTTNGCQGQAQLLVTVLTDQPPVQLTAPVISPGTGTYEGTQSITITTNDPGASIYYTTNGNLPRFDVPNSFTKLYTGPIQVVTSTTIRAVCVREGAQNSPISLAVITINNPTLVANPVISPNGGTFSGSATVTITTTTPDATVYYTTNGNLPRFDVPNSFTKLYTGPFTLFGSTTVRAIAIRTGWTNSGISVANFTINNPSVVAPVVFSPGPGTYPSPVSVSMTTSTPDAIIYYTTNGSVPLLNPFPNSFTRIYSEPVLLNSSRTLRAIAVKSGFQNSVTSVGIYTITNGVAKVSFDEHAEHPFYFEDNAITSDKPFSSLVYPNPSDGEYTLFINGQQEGECTVYVYSLLGTLVDKFTFSNTLGQHTISLKSKPSGAYLFRIQSGAFEEKIKVIKK